jgi:hypothetical protein
MKLTEDQMKELQKATFTLLKAVLARIEENNLTTADEIETVISSSLEDTYGEFLDPPRPPADPAVVKDVAQRMAKLAARK